MKYLIIGGVAGGATVAARLRRMDEKAEIILFERGKYVSYANCGLPYYIGDTINDRNKLFVQTVKGFTDRFRIDIRTEQEVTRILPESKQVEVKKLGTGETYTETYDKLVLSPGAEPLRPRIEGIESKKFNTGERFQIKGHTKVSFTPDTTLRDTINKPFAHFETVVLNEGTVLEDTPMEESDEEEASVADSEAEMVDSEVTEDKNTDEDTQEEIQPEEPAIEEPATEAVAAVKGEETDTNETVPTETEPEPAVIEQPMTEELLESEAESESILEDSSEEEPSETPLEPDFSPAATEEPVEEASEETIIEEPETEKKKTETTAEQIIAQELYKANMEPATPKKEPETEQPKAAYTDKDSDKKEKSAIPYLIATIIIVLLLCGGAILFIYYPDLFSSSSDSDKDIVDMPEAVQPVQPEAQLSDTIVQKDTVAEAAPVMPDETVQPKPVVKKEPAAEPVKAESKPAQQQQPATSVYSDSASYKITGTKTKYTIKEGETLTRVSLRFYGTKAMWPYIVKHNPKVIKNPDNVPYGTTIEIPELTKE